MDGRMYGRQINFSMKLIYPIFLTKKRVYKLGPSVVHKKFSMTWVEVYNLYLRLIVLLSIRQLLCEVFYLSSLGLCLTA